MASILIIEDSTDMQRLAAAVLSGHELTPALTLDEAGAALKSRHYDLIILDGSLPDGDGFDFYAKALTTTKDLPPVLVMTARSELSEKLRAFSLGVDDYITKPFEPLELKARVEARLRRYEHAHTTQNRFVCGDLEFNLLTQEVAVTNGKRLDLTATEFKLLLHFARHEDHILSREQILKAVWSDEVNVYDRTVDTHISHLRKKLAGSLCSIQPVYGSGYRFMTVKTDR